jgi:hypothetical protein
MDTKELTALAQGIANALGSEWEVELSEDGWSRRINHKLSKKVLYVTGDGYKSTKVNIGGSLHVGENGQYVQVYEKGSDGTGWERKDVQPIGVSIARGFDVIASEIKRRLLPEYDRLLTLALAQVQREQDYKNAKRANLERMARAAGHALPARDETHQRRDDAFHVSFGNLSVEVKAGDKDVDIKINNLTPEQAEGLLQILRGEKHAN